MSFSSPNAPLDDATRHELTKHSLARDDSDRYVYCVNGCGSRYVVAATAGEIAAGAPVLGRCVDCARFVDPTRLNPGRTFRPLDDSRAPRRLLSVGPAVLIRP